MKLLLIFIVQFYHLSVGVPINNTDIVSDLPLSLNISDNSTHVLYEDNASSTEGIITEDLNANLSSTYDDNVEHLYDGTTKIDRLSTEEMLTEGITNNTNVIDTTISYALPSSDENFSTNSTTAPSKEFTKIENLSLNPENEIKITSEVFSTNRMDPDTQKATKPSTKRFSPNFSTNILFRELMSTLSPGVTHDRTWTNHLSTSYVLRSKFTKSELESSTKPPKNGREKYKIPLQIIVSVSNEGGKIKSQEKPRQRKASMWESSAPHQIPIELRNTNPEIYEALNSLSIENPEIEASSSPSPIDFQKATVNLNFDKEETPQFIKTTTNSIKLSESPWKIRQRNRQISSFEIICSLEKDEGSGSDSFSSWFFNAETGACEWFSYKGFEGNGNRFNHRANCEHSCIDKYDNICSRKDIVNCVEPWLLCRMESDFYCEEISKETNLSAAMFCPPKQPICTYEYIRKSPDYPTHRSMIPSDCLLPKDPGCSDNDNTSPLVFHYDWIINDCRGFLYSNCGGNLNRFSSKQDCMNRCAI